MFVVLLSGGSGERLWPLSNVSRSKQYIRLLDGPNGAPQSMVQRVYGQLTRAGLAEKCILCAGVAQLESIAAQLGAVRVAVEPQRRNTFPAVLLSCAFLKSYWGAGEEDVVCILPVDPYTDDSYFSTLWALPEALDASGMEVALMGKTALEPSAKYGYILTGPSRHGFMPVRAFEEKPKLERARALAAEGALVNLGVFCFRLGDMLRRAEAYGVPTDYDGLCACYERLPRISFDREVMEKGARSVVVPFSGPWQDLGTWDALTAVVSCRAVGHAMLDEDSEDTHVVNETKIPVVVSGAKNMVIVASYDGILVADKGRTAALTRLPIPRHAHPMYEERAYGTVKVLDSPPEGAKDGATIRKLELLAGHNTGYCAHARWQKTWVLLSGEVTWMVDDALDTPTAGGSIRIPIGAGFALAARTDAALLEINAGGMDGEETIVPIADWAEFLDAYCARKPREAMVGDRAIPPRQRSASKGPCAALEPLPNGSLPCRRFAGGSRWVGRTSGMRIFQPYFRRG
ncbi:MAG TPA: sugar phosphate nucleotidyltransferase [Clostridia bacterium]|nr:sugar phosphate nucleotidyltransferase [Clostridia bacterium]